MNESDNLEVVKQMRSIAYINLLDALKGLKEATRLVDERIQRDGPHANFSIDSDLLNWSQLVWKASNKLYTLDSVIEELRSVSAKGEEASPVESATAGDQ
jgi:hypothetical protein